MLNIEPYRGISLTNSWLEKIIIQLNKDLSMTGFDKVFETNLTALEFEQSAIHFFEDLLTKNDNQLFNLLYRIDVNQNQIVEGGSLPQVHITKLIIEREFRKVVLKNEFSN